MSLSDKIKKIKEDLTPGVLSILLIKFNVFEVTFEDGEVIIVQWLEEEGDWEWVQ